MGMKLVNPRLTLLALLAIPAGRAMSQEVTIDRDNMEITESVKIAPGVYRVVDADNNGVLHIKGDNIIVDFQGATLTALGPDQADLSKAEGIGVAVSDARNATLANANVHGYLFNVKGFKAPGLKVAGCDVSRSRAQRIAAGGQPLSIWLHLRSLEAWRGDGAGLWLERCDGATVRGCRSNGAQNGLLLVDSAECTVTENDFSFNSGFGVGLWSSARNTVAFYWIDFVNRPWGGGWGGDAAGLVVVSASHKNYFVANSLTHGGDGFFLTDRVNGGINAERKTTRIEGSCDLNIIACNDGSWSPNNAFEGTFSTGNVYYRNLANDSNFGFWLGFSNHSLLLENEVLRNHSNGIAVEQGAGTCVEGNVLADNRGAAVALWSPDGWIRDLHPSTNLEIVRNTIRNCGTDYRLDNSTDVLIADNRVEGTRRVEFPSADRKASGAVERFRQGEHGRRVDEIMAGKPAGFVMYREGGGPKGLEWLGADDFAPRDYRRMLVAWRPRDAGSLEMLPLIDGELEFSLPDWMTLSREGDRHVAVARTPDGPGELREYVITVARKGSSDKQSITGSLLTSAWTVRWFRWDQPAKLSYDDADAWKKLFASEPIFTQTTRRLGTDLWPGAFEKGVPQSHFALFAATKVKLPAGRYTFSTLSDDGIRVFLDGKEIISRWNHHGPTPDTAELEIAEGVHDIEVHYCQEDGASALTVAWQKID